MIDSFSDYITDYLIEPKRGGRPCPGEHHFVAAYLVPKLYEISGNIPDYINPDGTKGIIGDVVYYGDHQHQFGIEVKLETIRLTKNEFNEWIVNEDKNRWPHTFIGIGTEGIAISSWSSFRDAYICSVKDKDHSWGPQAIEAGYGPMKQVNVLRRYMNEGEYFPRGSTGPESLELEGKFLIKLDSELRT